MDAFAPTTRLKGILFDFDGTLVDSLTNATECFNEALLFCGERPHTPEEIKRHFGTGADRILRQLLGDEDRAAAAFTAYKNTMKRRAHQIRLHDGVADLLDLLVQERIPIGIVTGRHEDDLRIVIEPHGIQERFRALIADNHVRKSKPDPEGLFLALDKMKLRPHETMYV
ncbi:MAG TPA: HAD hydrolase-like protein, partial [Pseudobdellovibrionaceae bacterium]|nr:HAD hydrolase-like protein [Pseudobdellovibrionaceae bacterium]